MNSANEATLKRTVAPADVFSALSELEFDSFRERLQKELDAHTEQKAGKRRAKKGPADTVGKPVEGGEANTAHGAKRVKRVSGEGSGEVLNRENGEEEGDGDETQDEPDMMNDEDEDNEEDVEEEEDDEGEGEGEGGEEDEEEEDINRVEDLDRDSRSKRTMDPDAVSDHSDSEEESGPSAQLRNDVGFG